MAPRTRTLLRVTLPEKGADEAKHTEELVESLMGCKPELRYAFIQGKAQFARDLDV
jgi:topoisomerase IV subunit B